MSKKSRRRGRRLRKLSLSAVLAALLAAAAITAAATWAWFSTQDQVTNSAAATQPGSAVPKTGSVTEPTSTVPQSEFYAELVDVFPTNAATTAMEANSTFAKRVGARNTRNTPAFVRVLVLPRVVAADGQTLLPAALGQQVIVDAWNTTDWRSGGDGWWYYLHKLLPGENTDTLGKNLFNSVHLAAGLSHGVYDNASLLIEVKCEAVRAVKWDYRTYWWGLSAAPTGNPLLGIDALLAPLAA